MKCVHTFGTGRHKRQADITLLFQYRMSSGYALLKYGKKESAHGTYRLCSNAMLAYPVGQENKCWSDFSSTSIRCVAAKGLARLCSCAASLEPLLLDNTYLS